MSTELSLQILNGKKPDGSDVYCVRIIVNGFIFDGQSHPTYTEATTEAELFMASLRGDGVDVEEADPDHPPKPRLL